MRIFIYILFIHLSLLSCTNSERSSTISSNDLIEQSELKSYLKNPNTVLIDIRKPEEFKDSHIPQAQNIWRSDIRNLDTTVEGLIASKKQMESLLGKLGANPESTIIVYDAKGNPDAARMWWILKYYGHEKVLILNGGLVAFDKTQLTKEIFQAKETDYKFINPTHHSDYADKELVLKAIEDTNYILLDTRCEAEFSGKEKKGNAGKSGRIPNSILIDYSEGIDYHNAYRFKEIEELKKSFRALDSNKTIITYCQSGVRSAHTFFILKELLNFKNVVNYDGSWLEWSNDTTLPIIQDSTLI